VPQSRTWPQPSPIGPQSAPDFAHVVAPRQELAAPSADDANPTDASLPPSSVEPSKGPPADASIEPAPFGLQPSNAKPAAKPATRDATKNLKTVLAMSRTLATHGPGASNGRSWICLVVPDR
jgi:hypothetical protein